MRQLLALNKRRFKIIWAVLNLLLIAILTSLQTGLALGLVMQSPAVAQHTNTVDTTFNIFMGIALSVLLLAPLSLPAAIFGLIVAAVDSWLLIRLLPRLRFSRWPTYLFAGLLGAGVVCGGFIINFFITYYG